MTIAYFMNQFKTNSRIAAMRIGMILETRAKLNVRNLPLIDTGRLLNSIKYTVTDTKDGYLITFGSYGVPYARIHEYGGIIRPVRAGALTIPVAPWAKGHRAADFDLFRPKNSSFLYRKDMVKGRVGSDGRLPEDARAFRLAQQAVIKEKRYMRNAIDSTRPQMIDILREALKE